MTSPTFVTDPAAWVQTFLRGPGGNLALADGLLLTPRVWHGPLTLPLDLLPRCCGPEEAMPYRVPADEFERRVGGLVGALAGGWESPPLLVQFTEGRWVLTDGNHRHEALRRRGASEALCLIWTTGEADAQTVQDAWAPWIEAHRLALEGAREGRSLVVGALVRRSDGRVFSQRRSASRRLFPGCWDLVGGHGEAGESPRAALEREVSEETGWGLGRILGLRRVVDWESPGPDGLPERKRELIFSVLLEGDPDAPRLEASKVDEGRWFGPADLAVLNENRPGTDTYVYDLVAEELHRWPTL